MIAVQTIITVGLCTALRTHKHIFLVPVIIKEALVALVALVFFVLAFFYV